MIPEDRLPCVPCKLDPDGCETCSVTASDVLAGEACLSLDRNQEPEDDGGAKQLDGKVPFDLTPWGPVWEMTQVLQFGAQKYDSWNWHKGISFATILGGVLRHIIKFMMGEDNDDESGLSHLAHAMCGLSFVLTWVQEGRVELDNRNVGSGELGNMKKPDAELWAKYAGFLKK